MRSTVRRPRRAGLAAAALLLAALVPGASLAGGTLRVGLESAVQGFDPLQVPVMGIATLTAGAAVLETLLAVGEDGTLEPRLALSLTPDADGLAWTARLRPGVRFHDGTPFDAAAVAAHFRRLLDPANACACRAFISPIAGVEEVDPLTVRLRLVHPWAALPVMLAEPSVVSLIGSPAALADAARPFNRNPVGTGPFRLGEWTPGGGLVLVRNPDYWRAGLPHLDRVEIRVLPDQQARLAAVRAGDLDLVWTDQARAADRAEKDPGLAVHAHLGQGARLLVLNTRRAPLDDRRVRRALAHALDMDMIARVLSEGRAPKATDPFGPGSPYQCAGVDYPAFDPATARDLLAQYGRPVRLAFLHTPTPRGREVAQIYQQFWQQVGVEVTLTPVEQGELVTRTRSGDFEIGSWRFRDSLDPDADLYGFLHSGSALNASGLAFPEIDALLEAGRRGGTWTHGGRPTAAWRAS